MATPDYILQAQRMVKPSGFMEYRQFLNSFYYHVMMQQKPYSYRKFAEDLGFGTSTVIHQIVNGYRPLTKKTAGRIARGMGLPKAEGTYLETLAEYQHCGTTKKREALFNKLVALQQETLPPSEDKDWLAYCQQWYHPVIRELVGTPGFKPDPKWIGQRLQPNLDEDKVSDSLALLMRLQLIAFDPKEQTYKQTERQLSTGSRVQGMGLVKYHQEMIALGREALTRVQGKRRHVTAMTFSCDANQLAKFRQMIQELQSQMLKASEEHEGDDVLQLNIQLFPFTDGDLKEKKK